jgi:hypothetical protein
MPMNVVISFARAALTLFVLFVPAAAGYADPTLSWKDPVTGNTWHFLSNSLTWNEAVAGCNDMGPVINRDAELLYRLPTLNEWWDAYDRLKDEDLARSLQVLQLKAWSADPMPGTVPVRVWALFLQTGNGGGIPADDLASAACISFAGGIR